MAESDALTELRARLYREGLQGNESADRLFSIVRHRTGAGAYCVRETADFVFRYFSCSPYFWKRNEFAETSLAGMAVIIEGDGWESPSGVGLDAFRFVKLLESLSWALSSYCSVGQCETEDLEAAFSQFRNVQGDLTTKLCKQTRSALVCASMLPTQGYWQYRDRRRPIIEAASERLASVAREIEAYFANAAPARGQHDNATGPNDELPKTIATPSEPPIRDAGTEARDRWIYGEVMNGIAYSAIRIQLNSKPIEWGRIDTDTGIASAAKRYAERHKKPMPAKRKAGRHIA